MKAPCIQLGTSNISTSVSKILNELIKLGYIISAPPPHISPDLYIVTNLDKLRGKVGFTYCVEKSYQREVCHTEWEFLVKAQRYIQAEETFNTSDLIPGHLVDMLHVPSKMVYHFLVCPAITKNEKNGSASNFLVRKDGIVVPSYPIPSDWVVLRHYGLPDRESLAYPYESPDRYRELLWEREVRVGSPVIKPSVREVSIKEIAELLGVPQSQIRIKE